MESTNLDKILDTEEGVLGEIYLITNIITKKQYVGQTRTHHKNRGKYRPFGYKGRFRQHISDALYQESKSTYYLSNAIRKYGAENFTTQLVKTCTLEHLDDEEVYYIQQYKTLYPNGYNLTTGGRATRHVKEHNYDMEGNVLSAKRRTTQTEATKALIKKRLLDLHVDDEERRSLHKEHAQNQHLKTKFEKLKDYKIDANNLEKYIKKVRDNKAGVTYCRLYITRDVKVSFYSRYDSLESMKERARNFLKTLVEMSATQPNCSGNP